MASLIQAFTTFGPRLVRPPRVRLERLSERLSDTTGLRSSEVMMVLLELRAALMHYARHGTALELPGLGTFSPSLRGDGRIRLLYRPDRTLLGDLDNLRTFKGEIANRENIGLSPEEYKTLWDEANPADPLDLTFGAGG